MKTEEMQKQIESMMPTPQQIVEHLDSKIEEKAKAYDKIVGRAKKELDACGSQDCDAARQIFRLFPELKESEDEKIRKEIIDFLLDGIWDTTIIDKVKQSQGYVKWISYLKNQGEQKFAWSKEDEKIYNLLYEEYKNIARYSHSREKAEDIPGEVLGWLKSLKYRVKPQTKQEWGEKDKRIRKAIIEMIFDTPNIECEINYNVCKEDVLAWLEKQSEQKEYTFKSLPRLLEMIEPSSRAKAYCQKLIDTLVEEGYSTDAKIVGECLKQMNGEDVPMAVMDENKGEQKPTDMDKIKEKAHQIAWESSKNYDPILSKESWCEMAALEMAYWLEKQKD